MITNLHHALLVTLRAGRNGKNRIFQGKRALTIYRLQLKGPKHSHVEVAIFESCFEAMACKFHLLYPPSSAEYDIPVFEKSGKGGTYPRRYGIPFGLQDYSDGG